MYKDRQEDLLYSCIGYIMEIVNSYSETLEVFKRLGFTDEELLDYGIRDLDTEKEIEYSSN